MMQIKDILLAVLISVLSLHAKSQAVVKEDVKTFVQNIPVIPAGIDEFHQAFTVETNDGRKLDDAAIFNPVYGQLKSWVSFIHEAVIMKKIEESPQANMSFSIQFEDERWKLALRPLIGAGMQKNSLLIKSLGQKNVEKLVMLEKAFDWLEYYKSYEKIKKDWNQKDAALGSKSFELERNIPMVNTEWGLQKDPVKLQVLTSQLANERVQVQLEIFQLHQEAWNNYFNKYKAAVIQLHQLLEEVHYGENISLAEQRILADIQARSLESIEKMVWMEMSLVQQIELIWFGKQLVEQFDKELTK